MRVPVVCRWLDGRGGVEIGVVVEEDDLVDAEDGEGAGDLAGQGGLEVVRLGAVVVG